jgi:hypothetical protein
MQVADLAPAVLSCSNHPQTVPKPSGSRAQTPPKCTPQTGTRTGPKVLEKPYNVTLCRFSSTFDPDLPQKRGVQVHLPGPHSGVKT